MLPKKTTVPIKDRKPSTARVDVSRAKLRERVKELTCLYGIAQIASDSDLPFERKLADIVRLLPPAWQYPSRSCARIVIDGQEFRSSRFRDGSHRQTAAICTMGMNRGTVEIHYRDGRGLLLLLFWVSQRFLMPKEGTRVGMHMQVLTERY